MVRMFFFEVIFIIPAGFPGSVWQIANTDRIRSNNQWLIKNPKKKN